MKLTILTLLLALTSCERTASTNEAKNENNSNYLATDKIFEKQIIAHIGHFNDSAKIVTNTITRDSIYSFSFDNDLLVSFGQYHSEDEKLNFGIIGIENFGDDMPTYLLADQRFVKHTADSAKIINDSIFVFGNVQVVDGVELFKIGFDLKFNGTNFPWSDK